MKLIIAGGRDIDDYEIVRQAVVDTGYWKRYKKSIEVVSGMALSWKWREDPKAGGVDRWGYEFAMRNNLVVHPFHADWKKHGKKAGYVRNREMGNFGDALLAVWDGKSTGTKDMIGYATLQKLEVTICGVRWDGLKWGITGFTTVGGGNGSVA